MFDTGKTAEALRKGFRGMRKDMEDTGGDIPLKKRRFRIVMSVGLFLCVVMFLISIAATPSGLLGVDDALRALVSAIEKGGVNLTEIESRVYIGSLPRTIAAVGVGAGLAVAGCIFQALIRNPMVDPYITGVSSGAGCAAIGVMALGATIPFLDANSMFIVPLAAILGGLAAFGITVAVAEGAGGSATNYILAGVIVGFAFTAFQTIFLSLSKDNLTDAMGWLYGSFYGIDWETTFLVLVPALGISAVSMVWAREFNLFMAGEEQAEQLGLNVRRFKRFMMVVASVLTAICVAFVGVIGFVGLVIPHACRMMLGGDHRLIMPASLVLGACLMMLSDLLAHLVFSPTELPVGAITALIGTPVFAYMLMRRGRGYDA